MVHTSKNPLSKYLRELNFSVLNHYLAKAKTPLSILLWIFPWQVEPVILHAVEMINLSKSGHITANTFFECKLTGKAFNISSQTY
jgi:uncharacterized protein YbaP (TraB family)